MDRNPPPRGPQENHSRDVPLSHGGATATSGVGGDGARTWFPLSRAGAFGAADHARGADRADRAQRACEMLAVDPESQPITSGDPRRALTTRDRAAAPPVHEITSTANPRVKVLRAIASSRGVRRYDRALVCGRRLVEEIARRHPDRVES